MFCAKRIVLEVLAPHRYYAPTDIGYLRCLEGQLSRQVAAFAQERNAGVALSFRFMAFCPEFVYQPGMDCDLIREAVWQRTSPLANK